MQARSEIVDAALTVPSNSIRIRALLYCLLTVGFFSFIWLGIRLATASSVLGQTDVAVSIFSDKTAIFGGELGKVLGVQLALLAALHVCFGMFVWRTADRVLIRFGQSGDRYLNGSFLAALVAVYWMYFANAWWYPQSHYAALRVLEPSWVSGLGLLVSSALLIGTALVAWWPQLSRGTLNQRLALAALFVLTTLSFLPHASVASLLQQSASTTRPSASNPDIIVIGIDSLRLDIVQDSTAIAGLPNLEKLIDSAVLFEDSYSPLSRTFPAWISILSGQYPATHGLRANLAGRELLAPETSFLTDILREAGYFTVYASDEKLFSNIDESYGYDRVLGPPAGAADILISKFYDVPLANLLSNTVLGRAIFPYTSGNRSAYYAYDPRSISQALQGTLHDIDAAKPVFLTAHFCLPHWPYIWRDRLDGNARIDDKEEVYKQSLRQVDRQLGKLMADLQASGRLENALLVLLSDHGEQFLPGEEQVFSAAGSPRQVVLPTMAGHGTAVMSDIQNRVLLSFKRFGGQPLQQEQFIDGVTSLVDVAPTLLSLAGIRDPEANTRDGLNLYLGHGEQGNKPATRSVFIETGLVVPAFGQSGFDMLEIASQGAVYYMLTEDGRVEIRPDAYAEIAAEKQFAAVNEEAILAVLKVAGKQQVYYRGRDGRTIDELPGAGAINTLFSDLCKHFAADLSARAENPCLSAYLTAGLPGARKRPEWTMTN